MKDTSFFAINKYKGPHTCVNACLNRDQQQLDSNLVVNHIKAMIKAQFTLSVAVIQATIMEQFGYEISYKKALVGKHKALTILFGDFYKSCRTATFLHGIGAGKSWMCCNLENIL